MPGFDEWLATTVSTALGGGPDDPNSGSDVEYGGGAGTGGGVAFSASVSASAGGGSDPDVADNLGTYPMPGPVGTLAQQRNSQIGTLLDHASQTVGKQISARTIIKFIKKWGWPIAKCAFNLSELQLSAVVASQITNKSASSRRGPHLYTVLKRIRVGERYTKMLARVAAKAHVKRKAPRQVAAARVVTFKRSK